MYPIRARASCTALLTFLIASAAQASEPAAPLRFAWSEGLSAKVEVHIRGQRVTNAGRQAHDARASYTLTTASDGDALLVRRSGFSGWKGQLPPRMGSAIDRMLDRVPAFRVSKNGDFLAIEGAAEARDAFAREVKLKSLDAASRRIFDMATTDVGLRAISEDFWNVSVGAWSQLGLEPGETREVRNQTPIPQLGGATIDMVATFRRGARVPCVPTEKEARCEELHFQSRADPEQVTALLSKNFQQDVVGGAVFEQFESGQEFHAVVEPGTLVPHRLTFRRTSKVSARLPGAGRDTAREATERTYVFHHAPATQHEP